jgi:trigger factor
MQVSVETTQGLERRMTVQVPSARVDDEVQSRLRELRGKVRLDGFRPGKVPLKVVEKRYGGQVRGEVLNDVVQQTYGEALEQEGLRPAGSPHIEPVQLDSGKDIEYQATFEVLPAVTVQGLEEIEIERPAVDITDQDVDGVVERLQRQHASYSEVERAAAEQDRVTFDFHGTVDGEEFEGNQGEDVPTVIGSGQMPSEFEAELVDVKAGEDKTIEYTFPEQFPDDRVAGKTASFAVKVKKVEAAELPALDDEFARQVGIEDGMDALRDRVRESLQRERDQAVRARVKQQAMDELLARNEVDLPKVLLDQEIQHLREQTLQRMKQAGQGDPEPDLPSSQFEDEARRRVTLGLLVNEIVRANELKLDQQRLQEALQQIASGYEQPQQVIQYYLQNRELMRSLEVQVMEDQVTEWLAERAKVTDKPMSFDQLMGRAGDEANA